MDAAPASPKPTGGSCSGAADSAKSCQGMVCLALTANVQKASGICSHGCQEDKECGAAADVCLDLGGTTGYCVRSCKTIKECSDGFVCLPLDDPADPISICFVEDAPGGTGGAGGNGAGGAGGTGGMTGTGGTSGAGGTSGGADCASKGCVIYPDPDMIKGYCEMTPNTKKLCDCPTTDVPTSCTPTNPAALNLYCCP